MNPADVTDPVAAQPGDAAVLRQKRQTEVRSAITWMWWIGGLTAVNVIASLLGTDFRMVVGATIGDVLMSIGREIGPFFTTVASVAAFGVAGIYSGLAWLFKKRGYTWAPIVVIVCYSLDLLLAAAFRDFLGVAFHALAIYFLVRGVLAFRALVQERRAAHAASEAALPRPTDDAIGQTPLAQTQETALESV